MKYMIPSRIVGFLGSTKGRLSGMCALAICALLIPYVLDPFYLNIANLALLAAMGAVGLNLLLGVAGQVSIANAAFLAIGGYTAATFAGQMSWPFVPTVLVAGVVGAVIGLGVGLPSLRLKGLYLVVATLALHYIVIYVAQLYQLERVGPGGFTLPSPSLLGWQVSGYDDWYFLLLAALLIIVLAVRNLMRTCFGRAWLAINAMELAAQVVGVNVSRYKFLAFSISSSICSVQGALLAYFNGVVSYESFTIALAVQYVAMVVIGGVGSLWGSVLGAALLTSLPFLMEDLLASQGGAQSANIQLLVFGAALVGFLLFAPRGIAGFAAQLRDWVSARLMRGNSTHAMEVARKVSQ